MKYEKIFETPILDELFHSRCDGFETEIIKEMRKLRKDTDLYKQLKYSEEFNEFIMSADIDFEIKSEILNKLKEYDKIYLDDLDYWLKQYYKLGFCDGMNLKNEVIMLEVDEDGNIG